MGQPVRVRIESAMRRRIAEHAKTLSAAVGRPLGVSAAIRDLLVRALDLSSPSTAYASGFREGFLRAYADVQRELLGGLREGRK
jgi:hypothetical protein